MRKLAIATVLVGVLGLGSSALACGGKNYSKGCDGDRQKGCSSKSSQCDSYDKGMKKGYMGHGGNIAKYAIDTIYAMNLSEEQEAKLDNIMKAHREKIASQSDATKAFGADKFDKKSFIVAQNTRDIMIQSKADMLEAMYKTLTKEQKVELKKELDNYNKNQNVKGCASKSKGYNSKSKGCGTQNKNTKGCS